MESATMTIHPIQQLQLIPPGHAARILGVRVRTLARWRRSLPPTGPPCHIIEGRAMYARAELEAWIEARRRGGTP